MHASPTWPIHGHYEWPSLGWEYRVPWTELKSATAAQRHQTPVPSLRSVGLLGLSLEDSI